MKEAFCNKMRAVSGRWTQWRIKELHELYCLQNIIHMNKSRRKGRVGRAECVGVHVPGYRFLMGKFSLRNYRYEDTIKKNVKKK
jgi:hypothetical protein